MSVDLESALEKRAGVLSHPLQTLRKQQEPTERLQSKELRSAQPMRDIKNNSSPALLRLSSVFIAVCFEVVCFHQCLNGVSSGERWVLKPSLSALSISLPQTD